jgi:hypothetical protein
MRPPGGKRQNAASSCRNAHHSPLGSLLVQHTTATLDASDGVSTLQRELGAAVAADIEHGQSLGLDGASRDGRAACAGGAGALGYGDLVGFARHFVADTVESVLWRRGFI